MASIRKRSWKSGSEVKTAWVADYFDQAGKRHIKTFRTKGEARDWLPETQINVKTGTHRSERATPTVKAAAEAWVRRGEAEQKERSTLVQRRQHIDLHILPLGADTKLSKVDVEAFRDELLRTRSRALAKKVMTSLKSILKQAKMGHLAAAVERIETGGRHKRRLEVGRDIPTPAEAKTLIDAATGYTLALLVVLVLAGLRISEALALRWGDLDWATRRIHLRQRANKWGEVGQLKSETSYRSIPMAPIVETTLLGWRGDRIIPGELLVFGNGVGNVESQGNIYNRRLGPLQIAAGVVDREGHPKYGAHSLRHSFAAWMLERGENIKRLSVLMGHSSPVVTMQLYSHLMPAEDEHERFAASEQALLG
jgi:integrase